MRRLPSPLVAAGSVFSFTAGILILVVIGLTVGDVLSRNLADTSILGTVDITTLLLVAIAFLGLAAAEVEGRHVTVDLIEAHARPQVRIVFAAARIVLMAGLCTLLVWGMSEIVISAIDRGETTNGILRLPTWPAKATMWMSFALFLVVSVWNAVNEFLDMKDGHFPNPHSEEDPA